jgi:hypothetical protein
VVVCFGASFGCLFWHWVSSDLQCSVAAHLQLYLSLFMAMTVVNKTGLLSPYPKVEGMMVATIVITSGALAMGFILLQYGMEVVTAVRKAQEERQQVQGTACSKVPLISAHPVGLSHTHPSSIAVGGAQEYWHGRPRTAEGAKSYGGCGVKDCSPVAGLG